MSIAALQYQQSLNEARYQVLAQKLDHLLSNLHEDPNTEVRWIWELIQNAKDVPNKFGKVMIKILIDDNSMTFSHNGDPFKPSDLESVMGQYSKKLEENSANVETTGKYGTGFVTTYVLSRKLKIKGIQHVIEKIDDEKPESPENTKNIYFNKFEIPLDREYTNRDVDLVKTLKKNEI